MKTSDFYLLCDSFPSTIVDANKDFYESTQSCVKKRNEIIF